MLTGTPKGMGVTRMAQVSTHPASKHIFTLPLNRATASLFSKRRRNRPGADVHPHPSTAQLSRSQGCTQSRIRKIIQI